MATLARGTPPTILGKRSKRVVSDDASSTASSDTSDFLPTPEDTPKSKRLRTLAEEDSSRSNKENIPPLRLDAIIRAASPLPRSFSRTTTESSIGRTPRTLHRTATGVLPSTPSTSLSGLSLVTPPGTPSALIPLHVRARGFLRATCNSTTAIFGRASERDKITKFLASFVTGSDSDASTSTLYVSGLPGTGKTALVNDILRTTDMSDVVVVNLNCMALNNADALWDRLQEDLGVMKKARGRGRPKKLDAKATVAKILEGSSTKCLLILDELDHISPSAGSLASLFSMVHDNRSSIRVIGIANTHTMTSTGALFDGVAGVDTLHFAAYSGQDLLEIIQTRLGPLYDDDHVAAMKKFLPLPALTLLGKKVAAQTGDVRAVFEVLRGAIDAAVMASSVTDAPAVSPAHVLSALKLYSPASTNTVTALPGSSTMSIARAGNSQLAAQVRQLGLQQRLVLLAIVLSMHRLQAGLSLGASTPALFPSVTKSPTKRARSAGSASLAPAAGSMDSSVLYTFYSSILVRGDGALFNPVPRSEFIDLLGMLETVGLISLSAPSGPRQISRTTSLKNSPSKAAAVGARAQDVKLSEGVRADEVLRGLGCQDVTEVAAADSREEEVLAIFDREQARITREVRNRTQSTSADVFSEATED